MLFTDTQGEEVEEEEVEGGGMEEEAEGVESGGWQGTAIMKRIWRQPTVCWS